MPLAQSSTRWKNLTSAVSQISCPNWYSERLNDRGFQKMLKVFKPRYAVPDQITFSRHYLPSLYHKQKAIVIEKMASGLKHFAITTDCWTSRAQHSFMSLTVHYISAKWNLQSHMLETGEITASILQSICLFICKNALINGICSPHKLAQLSLTML